MNNYRRLTIGSLFDGSGGFPLGGVLAGVAPVWNSEIAPFPIRVTTRRFPGVKHYGDIKELDGGEIPPVDIITFGSPCQDMSIAGKREGLDGSRSGLFHEAVRVIKEMRCKTNGRYPRYIVWENVPGAFSSNKGEDFRSVLKEICGIKDGQVHVPEAGKWEHAGCILGEGYSVAWRLFDSQYWGVPQRRKRIYLVADLDGGSAGKILFESEGLSGYSAEGFRAWQKAAGSIAEGTGEAGTICLNDQGGNRMDVTEEMTSTLRAEAHHPPCVMESAGFCTEHSAKSRSIGFEEETSPTLRAGTVPAAVYENHAQDVRYTEMEDSSPTVTARYGTGGNNQPLVVETPKTLKIRCGKPGGGKGALIQDDLSATLGCNNDQTLFQPVASGKNDCPDSSGEERCEKPVVSAYGICSKDSNAMKSANPDSGFYEAETSRTLDGNGGNPACNQGGIAVIEGNGTRPSHKGDGYSKSDVMYTLNATEQHGVAFAEVHASLSANDDPKGPSSQMMKKPEENFVCDVAYGIGREAFNQGKNARFSFQVQEELEPTIVSRGPAAVAHPTYSTSKNSHHTVAEKELANTLVASDYKDPPVINDTAYGFYPQMKTEGMALSEELSGTLVNGTNPGYQNGVVEPDYIVRRLAPVECARLQGFPDWWCDGLETEEPTQEDIDFWRDVFETADRAMGKTVKTKSDAQIAKWLKDPYSDSAAYSMWGNGISLPIAFFVLSGIVWADENL